jgi:hypothetical protein
MLLRSTVRDMVDSLKTLAGILEQVANCRRWAIEVKDAETAETLSRLADDLERYVRRTVFPSDDSGSVEARLGKDTATKH